MLSTLVLCLCLKQAWAQESRPAKPGTITIKFYPLKAKLEDARQSYYSPRLFKVLEKWPPKEIPKDLILGTETTPPVWMRPVRTVDQPNYFGVLKRLWVNAPMGKVEEQIESFEKYPELFPDVKEVVVVRREGNMILTAWERYSPVFFVPNTKYEMIYIFDKKSNPRRHVYRYQLKNGNNVNFTDGLVVLEPLGDGSKTQITHYDFFDANFGPFRALAEGAIWQQSLEGSFKGDVAFKSKVENPSWGRDQLEDESRRLLEKFPVDARQFIEKIDLD